MANTDDELQGFDEIIEDESSLEENEEEPVAVPKYSSHFVQTHTTSSLTVTERPIMYQ